MNVLISIDNGFSSRYIIRSGLLEYLIKSTNNIYYIAVHYPDEYKYLESNFFNRVFFIQQPKLQPDYSIKGRILHYINLIQKLGMPRNNLYSAVWVKREIFKQQESYSKVKIKTVLFFIYFHKNLLIVRKLARYIVYYFQRDVRFDDIINKHKINLLILDGLSSLIERNLFWLTTSRKLRVRSATLITNWDHPTSRGYQHVSSDEYIVWGNSMIKELKNYQDIPITKIYAVGSMIFDMYADTSFIVPFDIINLKANNKISKKYILFVSNSPYYPFNLDIIKFLRCSIPSEISLVVRLHPLYLDKYAEEELLQHKELANKHSNLIYFFPVTASSGSSADMSYDEIQLSASLIANCSVMINLFSTMMIDCIIMKKPMINIAFDWSDHNMIPLTMSKAKFFIHINRILNVPGVYNVTSKNELLNQINELIINDNLNSNLGNADIVKNECGMIDGKASCRIAKVLFYK